jgi:hypothetical protein
MDRHHNAFRPTGIAGGTILTKLLQKFALFDSPFGYLQGMNDLLVLIILR